MGVNTATPGFPFHVFMATDTATAGERAMAIGDTSAKSLVFIPNATGTVSTKIWNKIIKNTDVALIFRNQTNNTGLAGLVIAPENSGSNATPTGIRIAPDGSVGIGTSCPNEKLTVNGKIKARYEVLVQETGGFCDYVFEETYKRPTYLEKEIWFKKNKRLYNMPSGKEIEAEGLPMTTAIKSLTLNTEENSLDIIELYKKIEKVEKENEILKQMLIRYGVELGFDIIKK